MQDVEIDIGDFPLERGGELGRDIIRGRWIGNPDGPTIMVLGGISANRFVADGERYGRGWWGRLVHKGGPIDLNKFKVIGYDFAPNLDADCGLCPVTTRDQAERLARLLDALEIQQLSGLIGSSYGGMCGLALAQYHPSRLKNLCVISAAHRPYPIGVAWRGIQRRIVRLGLEAGTPEAGLKLARELAMTTYRTPTEFADRFALTETSANPSLFDICDYLGARGDAFASATDAKRFLVMSESIDLHRIEPEAITTPTLLMTAISDQIAPLPEMRELCDRLGGPSELFTFTSLFGHDAFLKEYDAMGPRLEQFCAGLM
jgi:homoserine O-acetyltransferase